MKIEPNADLRQMGNLFYQMKVAFQMAGFTSKEAFELTRSALVAQLQASSDDSEEKE